ncbi:MAG: hypothetical protein ABIT37_22425 [Luteolibacter sp.]
MKVIFAFAVLILLASCALPPHDDARPGINRAEAAALKENYYWRPGDPTAVGDDASLEALMRRSINPGLDGEGAELQISRVAVALAEVGDDRFCAVLSRQEPAEQKEVTDSICYMWRHYELRYPKTRVIHAKFNSQQESSNPPTL